MSSNEIKQIPDTETAVIQEIIRRKELGFRKYGVSVSMNGLTHKQWLQHAFEEALDMAIYLKRAIQEMEADNAGKRDRKGS